MSFYDKQTRTVVLDDENNVTVRKLTYGEQQAAMSAAMSFEMTLATGKGEEQQRSAKGKLDPLRMKREELYAAVVSWSGPGFDGRPVTKENIEALPPEIIDAIQSGVDDLNGGLDDDEKKASAAITNMP
ncbi:MAG: hypothetical protein KF753_04985 [Caldilineaceae bacterium]|nr:hypothetical protein [Caldilineaceae bacterium]